MNAGGAAASPGASCGNEHIALGFREIVLLFRRKLHHAAGFVGIAECGENFAAHPKIGMVPVGAFFGLGQGELAKVGGGPMGFQISDLRFQIAGYKPLQATNLQSAI